MPSGSLYDGSSSLLTVIVSFWESAVALTECEAFRLVAYDLLFFRMGLIFLKFCFLSFRSSLWTRIAFRYASPMSGGSFGGLLGLLLTDCRLFLSFSRFGESTRSTSNFYFASARIFFGSRLMMVVRILTPPLCTCFISWAALCPIYCEWLYYWFDLLLPIRLPDLYLLVPGSLK